MHQCNWRGVVSDRVYCIPASSPQNTGPNVFGCLCRGTGSLFWHALDLTFTDKGIQAYRLRVHRASGQSAVCRHTWAFIIVIIVVVVVVVVVVIAVTVNIIIFISVINHFNSCFGGFNVNVGNISCIIIIITIGGCGFAKGISIFFFHCVITAITGISYFIGFDINVNGSISVVLLSVLLVDVELLMESSSSSSIVLLPQSFVLVGSILTVSLLSLL